MPKSTSLTLLDVAAEDEDVARLDVAVDEPALVREGERADRAAHHAEALGDGEPLPGEPRGEILAVEPLHREVALAGARDAVRHVADDAGVAQIREDGRLALEALDVDGLLPAQELEGDARAVELVDGAVDRAHPTGARLGDEDEAVCDGGARVHPAIIYGFRKTVMESVMRPGRPSRRRGGDSRGSYRRACWGPHTWSHDASTSTTQPSSEGPHTRGISVCPG